jgi:RNA polymerase sigma-70 factor (ECF subfamily)
MAIDPASLTPDDLRAATAGDAKAVGRLVQALTPSVRVGVARALYDHGPRRARGALAQEVDDVAQEVFEALFEDGARVLRSWDPGKGASLAAFVRMVAVRTTISILRSGRRTPWREEPSSESKLDVARPANESPEALVGSRELAEKVFDALRAELTPRGYVLFLRLIVQEEPVGAVCADLGMQPDAVYAWRARFGKLVARLAGELDSTMAASDPNHEARRDLRTSAGSR